MPLMSRFFLNTLCGARDSQPSRYKHFGRDVIRVVTGGELSDETVSVLYERVYTNFIEHIDGIDNGIEAYEGAKRYKVR